MIRNFELHSIDQLITEREVSIFNNDIKKYETKIKNEIQASRFIVLGGAGSIGQSVVSQLFKRNPLSLHVIDINENNLVELTRDLRSSFGYIYGEFTTSVVDIGSSLYNQYVKTHGPFDYVINLTAMKHVRSEKDSFSLARLINTNIFNTIKTCELAAELGAKKYFCVSTDKASNPVNMMGASKRIMELFLIKYSNKISISTARFANVAFSDGSLPNSFKKRIEKKQPIVAPNDVERYFVSHDEAGELCLLSCILGKGMEIFFPKLDPLLTKKRFDQIAIDFLKDKKLDPYICKSEDEARSSMKKIDLKKYWPCLFDKSDTTGEKPLEEFFNDDDMVELEVFDGVGIVKSDYETDIKKLDWFRNKYQDELKVCSYPKHEIVNDFVELLPNFHHEEKSKSLEEKM